MNKHAKTIIESLCDSMEVVTDEPERGQIEKFANTICVMQLTQALPEQFGRDVIKKCPKDDIFSRRFDCPHCAMAFLEGWYLSRTSNQIYKELVVEFDGDKNIF